MQELGSIVEQTRDTNLTETDIRRLHCRRLTLSTIYQFQTAEIAERQKQELIDGVKRVEEIWGRGQGDNIDRESHYATKFGDISSTSTH